MTWIEADARSLDFGRRFDAVEMTGHAFQALLTHDDRAAVLGVIARHLALEERFFFDSRNPEAREWESWTPDLTRERRAHPQFGMVERWHDAQAPGGCGLVQYGTHYLLPDGRQFAAVSRISFPSFAELSGRIAVAGLRADRWAGDALGGPLGAGSVDLIPIGRLADAG